MEGRQEAFWHQNSLFKREEEKVSESLEEITMPNGEGSVCAYVRSCVWVRVILYMEVEGVCVRVCMPGECACVHV